MQHPEVGSMERAFQLLHEEDSLSREKAYTILRRSILRWGIWFCGDNRGPDAEDNTHDVVASTLPHLLKLPDSQALSAYLYTAAHNRYLDTCRTSAGYRTVALQHQPGGSDLELHLIADRSESPEDRAARLQQQHIVHRAMRTLPARYRIVVLLHDVEDLNTNLVARILALAPGTVRVQLHRARLLLRRRLNAVFCYPRLPIESETGPSTPFARAEAQVGIGAQKSCEPCTRRKEMRIRVPAGSTDFTTVLERAIDRCWSLVPEVRKEVETILRRELVRERARFAASRPRATRAGPPPVPSKSRDDFLCPGFWTSRQNLRTERQRVAPRRREMPRAVRRGLS